MEQHEARLAALDVAITELRARVAEIHDLRTAISALENRLTAERTRIRTMRQTLRCPSCGGGRILHFAKVSQSFGEGAFPLSLNQQKSGWLGMKYQPGEPMQVFGCRTCGLLEWHAAGLDGIEPDGKDVVELTSGNEAPSTEPYR